jgi:hypothetical protein
MILSNRLFVLALPVVAIGFAAFAQDNPLARQVVKSDGSTAQYRLLPVHYSPGHAAIVNRRMTLSSLNPTAIPAQYQISTSALPVVRDQGSRGTCAYFATVGVLESYYLAKSPSNAGLTLSEECLVDVRNWMSDQGSAYTGADAPSQRPDPNGDLPVSIIQTISGDGVPTATKFSSAVDCTYDGSNTNGNDVALTDYLALFSSTNASNTSVAYGKGVSFDESTAPTIDRIKALIASNVPVEVGIVVYEEFMNEVDWRFDAKTDTADDIAGGHAIMLTGYQTQNGKTIFTFKNSWGATWGNSGYGTLDDGVLTNSWGYDATLDFITSLHD